MDLTFFLNGGGDGANTFNLLYELKISGVFEKIKSYIENEGIIFSGSAGTIIFGELLESCILDDTNRTLWKREMLDLNYAGKYMRCDF